MIHRFVYKNGDVLMKPGTDTWHYDLWREMGMPRDGHDNWAAGYYDDVNDAIDLNDGDDHTHPDTVYDAIVRHMKTAMNFAPWTHKWIYADGRYGISAANLGDEGYSHHGSMLHDMGYNAYTGQPDNYIGGLYNKDTGAYSSHGYWGTVPSHDEIIANLEAKILPDRTTNYFLDTQDHIAGLYDPWIETSDSIRHTGPTHIDILNNIQNEYEPEDVVRFGGGDAAPIWNIRFEQFLKERKRDPLKNASDRYTGEMPQVVHIPTGDMGEPLGRVPGLYDSNSNIFYHGDRGGSHYPLVDHLRQPETDDDYLDDTADYWDYMGDHIIPTIYFPVDSDYNGKLDWGQRIKPEIQRHIMDAMERHVSDSTHEAYMAGRVREGTTIPFAEPFSNARAWIYDPGEDTFYTGNNWHGGLIKDYNLQDKNNLVAGWFNHPHGGGAPVQIHSDNYVGAPSPEVQQRALEVAKQHYDQYYRPGVTSEPVNPYFARVGADHMSWPEFVEHIPYEQVYPSIPFILHNNQLIIDPNVKYHSELMSRQVDPALHGELWQHGLFGRYHPEGNKYRMYPSDASLTGEANPEVEQALANYAQAWSH